MSVLYLIVLRIVHIASSVGWAGGSFVFFFFIEPTAKALAPTGAQFVQHMVAKRRFNVFMVIASTLTVLTGGLLLWKLTSGQLVDYARTGPGLGFILGSIAGVVVYCIGMFGVAPRAKKMAEIGQEIQEAGGPPTAVQGSLLQKLDKEMSSLGLADFILVALSLGLMGTARYWWF